MKWPVTLQDGAVTLRPLQRRDSRRWQDLRRANHEWLKPWEATLPQADPAVPGTFAGMVRSFRREATAGRSAAFALDVEGTLMGQVTLGGLTWGSLRSGYIGYWISQEVAGRGIMPRAVALVVDYALGTLMMHRIEINIRPENQASLRVVEKLGFRKEGFRPGYLHIDGDWRDHVTYCMLAGERPPQGLLRAVHARAGRYPTVRDTGDSVLRIRPPHP